MGRERVIHDAAPLQTPEFALPLSSMIFLSRAHLSRVVDKNPLPVGEGRVREKD
jgi:hypothetical protein